MTVKKGRELVPAKPLCLSLAPGQPWRGGEMGRWGDGEVGRCLLTAVIPLAISVSCMSSLWIKEG